MNTDLLGKRVVVAFYLADGGSHDWRPAMHGVVRAVSVDGGVWSVLVEVSEWNSWAHGKNNDLEYGMLFPVFLDSGALRLRRIQIVDGERAAKLVAKGSYEFP